MLLCVLNRTVHKTGLNESAPGLTSALTLYDKARDMELWLLLFPPCTLWSAILSSILPLYSLCPPPPNCLLHMCPPTLPPPPWYNQPNAARGGGGGGELPPPTRLLQNSLSFCEILHIADLLLAVRWKGGEAGCSSPSSPPPPSPLLYSSSSSSLSPVLARIFAEDANPSGISFSVL